MIKGLQIFQMVRRK